ncbi:hypothetical protein POUND7_006144 [Theobroma cacao]
MRSLGGYLTDGSKPNLTRVEHFIQAVGSYQDKIFQKRARLHQRQAERIKREKAQAKRDVSEPDSLLPVARFNGSRLALGPSLAPFQPKMESLGQPYKMRRLSSSTTIGAAIVEAEDSMHFNVHEYKEELKAKLKELIRDKSDIFNSENQEEDKIKLGEPGWKERYYVEKFSANTPEEMEAIRKDVVLRYTEGLCWVMHYYYEGVCSWWWFYPYHYAPFASDLKDLGQLDIQFVLGSPFKPFNQLLGVFPAASAHALPEQYRKLMSDPNSPIIDFYPTDFEIDMNGKRYSWQASHRLSEQIFSLDNRCRQLTEKERIEFKKEVKPDLSDRMNGYISPSTGYTHPPIFRSPIKYTEDILANEVISCIYRLPKAQKHITRPLAAVIFPPKIVQFSDLKTEPVLWHEDSGRRAWENGRSHAQVLQLMERHNTPGAISGRSTTVICRCSLCPTSNSHVNYGFHNQGQHIRAPPGLDYFSAGYPISQTSPLRPHLAHGYNEPYGSPHQYQINNQAAANNFHYPPRDHQNGGSRHMPRPTTQLSMEIGLYPSRPGGYDGNRMYQAPGTGSHQEWGGGMGPQANQNVSGGYGLHQQGGVNRGLHSGHDHQQQRGNQMHNQRGGYHQRGSQLRRGNQQHGGIQQQRGNSYVALDRQRHRRPLAPPVENSH